MKIKTLRRMPALASCALAMGMILAACGGGGTGSSTSGSSSDQTSIGFFGVAKSNSFTQAMWKGVQEEAEKQGATATFIDGNFDASTQVSQVRNAVVSKKYDVLVIFALDGVAMQSAAQQAASEGFTVAAAYVPIGTDFGTYEPQIPDTISVVTPFITSGENMAALTVGACEQLDTSPCEVAYLQGATGSPNEEARNQALEDGVAAAGDIDVVATVVGGYAPDTGRSALQNVLQAHPDVDVVVGASQAIQGAAVLAASQGKDILFVANGGSSQAYEAVESGTYYGLVDDHPLLVGAKAAELAIAKARGEDIQTWVDTSKLSPAGSLLTQENIGGLVPEYSD